MTMHYELKGRHEVCFKAEIELTGLIVNSKAKNLNSKAWTTGSKSFRTPCQVQRLEVSVVHVVDRVLHCTVYTDHLNYN